MLMSAKERLKRFENFLPLTHPAWHWQFRPMSEPRLEHQNEKVKHLIDAYRSGRIVIPEFQRDEVWKKSKAPLLIDSLYRGFPISSLLLWQSDEETRPRRRHPRAVHASLMSWLIDGQQRIIMLEKVMNGDIEVVFNPKEDKFRLANAATRHDPNWIRIAELWDDELYNQLRRRNLDGGSAADKRDARFEKVRRTLDYEVPLVRMVEYSSKDAVLVFERINTLGVRLKKEDIQSARVAYRHSGFIADEVSPFLARLKQQGFNRLNIMHLFRACAFVAKPDGRNRTPLHDLEKNEVLRAWKETKRATEQAIGLIRAELGLVNMDILWSGALLVPIIALCAATGPRNRDSKGLMAWLALAALPHRYSGSSETKLDEDLKACRDADPIGALLKNLRQRRPVLLAESNDFSGALADRSGLLALYIACLNRGMLNFYTGEKVLLQNDVNRHHILPRGQFPDQSRATADNVANIAFIVGDVNKSIGQTGPEVYLKDIEPEVLDSQCIPEDKKLWAIDHAEGFWAARRELLADSFNDFLKDSLPQRRLY
jgi:hypothetical protein